MRIGAQDVRQRHRIDMIALLARHRRAFAIASHRQRIDRVDRPAARAEHRDQQPARCLDRDGDRLVSAVAGRGQHRGQLRDTVQALLDTPLAHQLALVVDERDVVMPLGPIDAAVDRHAIP
jgi:hypothetical protein